MSGRLLSMFGGGGSNIKFYALNFDGSHNNQANESGAGCIIRDNHGELVVAAAYNLTVTYPDYCDVAIAEAIALRNGLILAKDHSLNVKFIKGDNKEVIDHVRSRRTPTDKPRLSKIIGEIIENMDSVSDIERIDGEFNKVADTLASWGRKNLLDVPDEIYTTYDDLPPQVADLIKKDMATFTDKKEVEEGEGSSQVADLIKKDMATFTDKKEVVEGEGSSVARKIGMAVAGVAVLAWVFGETSSDV